MTPTLAKDSGKIFLCYEKNEMSFIREKCIATITLTSILSEDPLIFPENSGIILDPVQMPYYLFEGHFINPLKNDLNLSVVFRTWMTSKIYSVANKFVFF